MSDETILKVEVEKEMMQDVRSWGPWLLIGGGITLLALNLFHISLMNIIWPLFILVPGLVMLLPAYRATAPQPSAWSFLAVPGAFLTLIGVFLVATNFGHGEIWSYGWTLMPASVVAGVMLMNRHDPNHPIHVSGRKFVRGSLIVFLALGLIMELLAFSTLGPWWPVVLIVWGLYLFARSRHA
ncbi:MAG: hypothetical protein KA314_05735 [Chloroflexi bacterium]|nr:hypothetical protein [Chloroflexota bacterium]MBP8055321.1 hypothetical protein [Chloroflexota bacterium]